MFIQTLLSSGIPKYIIIINKYKQCVSLESSKRTEWELLEVTTILNTKKSILIQQNSANIRREL